MWWSAVKTESELPALPPGLFFRIYPERFLGEWYVRVEVRKAHHVGPVYWSVKQTSRICNPGVMDVDSWERAALDAASRVASEFWASAAVKPDLGGLYGDHPPKEQA